jgi:hypothetical protein
MVIGTMKAIHVVPSAVGVQPVLLIDDGADRAISGRIDIATKILTGESKMQAENL